MELPSSSGPFSPRTVDCWTQNMRYSLPKRRKLVDTTLTSVTTRKLQLDPYKELKYNVGTYRQGMTYGDGVTRRGSSETLTVNHQTTWRHITRRQYSHYHDKLKYPSASHQTTWRHITRRQYSHYHDKLKYPIANSPSFPGYNFFLQWTSRCVNRNTTTNQMYVKHINIYYAWSATCFDPYRLIIIIIIMSTLLFVNFNGIRIMYAVF
jgi:hypothetical protein